MNERQRLGRLLVMGTLVVACGAAAAVKWGRATTPGVVPPDVWESAHVWWQEGRCNECHQPEKSGQLLQSLDVILLITDGALRAEAMTALAAEFHTQGYVGLADRAYQEAIDYAQSVGAISLEAVGRSMAYHIYVIERDRITLEARRYAAERDRFEAWPDAPGSGVLWEESAAAG